MKSTYVVAIFAIVGITSSHLCSMDFLNDPFFKQLAGELDSMFGVADDGAQPAPYTPAKSASPFGAKAQEPLKKDEATTATNASADSTKDLKTLFIENLETSQTKAGSFGSPAAKQTKIVISKKRLQAYHLYMDDLVKKTRLIERIVASNPARTFGYRFFISFDALIDFVDTIETVHQLVLSKKMYLRNFFGQPMQKTREQIVALMPKLDAVLRKLRPLLNKEESLDDDIARMQREATKPKRKTAPKKKSSTSPRSTGRGGNIGRALPHQKNFTWPKSPPKPPKGPLKKKPQESLRTFKPVQQFPADFSLKKFMHEKGVSR